MNSLSTAASTVGIGILAVERVASARITKMETISLATASGRRRHAANSRRSAVSSRGRPPCLIRPRLHQLALCLSIQPSHSSRFHPSQPACARGRPASHCFLPHTQFFVSRPSPSLLVSRTIEYHIRSPPFVVCNSTSAHGYGKIQWVSNSCQNSCRESHLPNRLPPSATLIPVTARR